MSQTELTSDSDSSTSSWIFVDEYISDNEADKNKYYLNCSTEPIQELTPQCLNSINNEQETDSDGISIISESDDCKEQSSNEEQVIVPHKDVEISSIEVIGEKDKNHSTFKEEFYLNKYIIVGWVLIAIITPFLLNYLTTIYRINDDDEDRDKVIKDLKGDVNNHALPGSLINLNMLDIQQEIPKDNNKIAIKKKYESKGEADIHRLEYNIQNNKMEKIKEINTGKENKSQESIKIKKDEKSKNKKDKKIKQYHLDNERCSNKKCKLQNEHKKNEKNKENKNDSERFYIKQINKFKKTLRKKDKELKEISKLLKIKDKQLKFLEYKILKELNILRKYDLYKNQKNFMNSTLCSGKMNGTLTEDWYTKLHKGRSFFRNQQLASAWIFDKVVFRNKKRDKRNNWYWNWMIDREQLRLKRGS